MNGEFSYDDFVSRNYLYIGNEIQEKIKNTKLVFFGTGLSSLIAEHCARLGFMHMHLNDGDTVESSNLNRQSFNLDDMGHSKAQAVKNKIVKINPLSEITIGKTYISSEKDFNNQIDQCDIVINTVDCNKIYFDIIEYARAKGKLVICPFNPGFSGLAVAFSKRSASSHDMFDTTNENNLNDVEVARQLFEKYPQLKTLKQVNKTAEEFLWHVVHTGYFPQITIGALLSTALVLTTLVRFLKKEPITLAPDIICLNSYMDQDASAHVEQSEFLMA